MMVLYRGKAVKALGAIIANYPEEEWEWMGQAVGLIPYVGYDSNHVKGKVEVIRKPELISDPKKEPEIELPKGVV